MVHPCPVCCRPLDWRPCAGWPPPPGPRMRPPYGDWVGSPSSGACPQCFSEFGAEDDPGFDSMPVSFEAARE